LGKHLPHLTCQVQTPHSPHHSAGVTGLSAAIRLQEKGHKVTIVARDFPTPFETADARLSIDYASMWAGAHNRFILPRPGIAAEERDHAMSLTTFARMDDLAKRYPEAAITFMKGVEYFEAPSEEYRALTEQSARDYGFQDFRFLRRDELPDDNVRLGFEYRTWCVNPMVYCAFLLRRFVHAGGKTLVRTLRDEREALSIPSLGAAQLIINCSGYGFGDKASFITRGKSHAIPFLRRIALTHHRRPDMSRSQRVRCHRNAPECRRLMDVFRPKELSRRHRHRRHKGARQLGSRALVRRA
jgi:glycine/D-amino acid oxidase-like deaminating enzyme